MKKMFFVYNPKAGKETIKSCLADVLDIFTKGGYEVTVRPTQSSRDAYEMVKEYHDQVDLVVCSGGDGTLDEVVTGLMEVESKVPVGYLPAGSTNDFANSLFIPSNITAAAHDIMEGSVYRCDVGTFNNQTFAYVAAFGLFTDVSYQTDQNLKNVFGHGAYILEGVKRLFDIKSYHMKIESAEVSAEDDFIYGMITNSRSVGGFKNLTGKNVDMDDGLFEVTLITMPRNPMELNEILTALATREDNTDRIYSFKSARIRIESADPVPWTLDGEYGGTHQKVEIINHHQALPMLLRSHRYPKEND